MLNSDESEIFQHVLENALQGLKGVKNLIDDILVFGRTQEEHDENLHALLRRLEELGSTSNLEKCVFRKTSLEFFGLRFSNKCVALTGDKVRAFKDEHPPKNASELRSFLGLVSYCNRSILKAIDMTSSLWEFKKDSVKWNWIEEHQKCFDAVKNALITEALGYFSADWDTFLEVDASEFGAAGILRQENP